MSTLFRSGPRITATRSIVGSSCLASNPPVKVDLKHELHPITSPVRLNAETFKVQQHGTIGLRASTGISSGLQVRFAHTDLKVPDFTHYRRESTRDPTKPKRDGDDARRLLTYSITYGLGGMSTLMIGKQVVHKVVAIKSPAADQLAMANTEINITDIPEGKSQTFMWRGKPVFVYHRNAAEIERERAVNLGDLRDPQHDDQRVKKPEWLVVIGICTHLGCIPLAGQGEFGGYYCPCHGSHYDASGRIRKGPAPANLEVPDYVFVDENKLLVGTNEVPS